MVRLTIVDSLIIELNACGKALSTLNAMEQHKPIKQREELLRYAEPGEQIGIRLAHHVLSEATQSSLSAFHNAGLGTVTATRISPSLQQIMDGTINQSNTSMLIKTNNSLECITRRNLRYYVDKITNSFVDKSLNEDPFWYAIANEMGLLPKWKRSSKATTFRFHLNYRKMASDSVTIKYFVDNTFSDYIVCYSPDFIGIVDVHLKSDAQLTGMMEILGKNIGVKGISNCCSVSSQTLATIGSNLGEILIMLGVDNERTVSNNAYDVEKNFGIEAAREVLYAEILSKIDNVHTAATIVDFMTCKGFVAPFKKDNPMLKARGFLSSIAFERPKKDVKEVIRGRIVDSTSSVYSQIITGQLPDVGSGSRLFSLEEGELDWSEM